MGALLRQSPPFESCSVMKMQTGSDSAGTKTGRIFHALRQTLRCVEFKFY